MVNSRIKSIVHVGKYHHKDDIRIFCKECKSLVSAGYKVSYITSDIYGDSESYEADGVQVCFYCDPRNHQNIGLGIRRDLFKCIYLRIVLKRDWIKNVVNRIMELNPDVVHVHEYEVLPAINKLLRVNRKIKLVYDIHEDNPRQLGQWYRTNKSELVAWIAEKIIEIKESHIIKKAALVFTATDYISNIARKHNEHVYTVKNYPKSDDIYCDNGDLKERESNYCYSGGITEDRGITILVKNSDFIKGKFLMAGNIDENYKRYLAQEYSDLWERNVEYKGYLTRQQVNNLYSSSVVGLCTLHYHPNYINALPIKLFEYMAAGIPVISSNFPIWQQIVEDAECGLVVDPYDEKAIVEAINRLLSDRELAKRLGDNGKKAIKEKYSWEHEERILIEAYRSIL